MRGHPLPRGPEWLAIICALAVLAWLPAASFAQSEERIIVKRDPGLSAAERADLRADVGAHLVDVLSLPQTEVVTVPAHDADAALAKLNADPNVVYAERDRLRAAVAEPNDELWGSLWGLSNTGQDPFGGTPGDDIHLLDAWRFSDGSGQTVAVVDSGIDSDHVDLAGQIAGGGYNFVQGNSDLRDLRGHGTHLSGTIAARGNNTIGVVGVAPGAKVLPLRIFGNSDVAPDSVISQAFDYAGDRGVRVVNASLGSEGGSGLTLSSAIGRHPSTLYVVAAGNGGGDRIGDNNDVRNVFPCNVPQPNVVCVGATDYNDQRTPFSNYGAANVDLFAPGMEIASTWPGGEYVYQNGTSMAAPHVSGEAALLLAAAPSLGAQELKDLILGTVDLRPNLFGLSVSGGRANAGAALRQLVGSDADGDGVVEAFDSCPTLPGNGSDGCPAVVPPRPVSPTPPTGPDPAPRGLPPRVGSLKVNVRPSRCRGRRPCRRRVTIAITGDRAATATVTIEFRRCDKRRCRWVVVARGFHASAGGKATVTVGRRLARGSYRATVVLSSSLGAGPRSRRAFRIR